MPANSPEPLSRRLPQDFPVTRLLPNMLTLMSLCSGLTGVRFALLDRWHEAIVAYLLAAVFDMLDGRVARMMNITSKFGAELDSLSDAVSFGVAPGFIIYEWVLKNEAGSLGWIAVLIYAVCAALRLARFNTMLDGPVMPAWTKGYFTGVPAPGAAGLALMPLVGWIEFGDVAEPPPFVIAFWLMFVGALMVSRLPTFALKGWRITPIWVTPIFIFAAALIAGLATDPWLTLWLMAVIYFISLPIGWYTYRRRMQRENLV